MKKPINDQETGEGNEKEIENMRANFQLLRLSNGWSVEKLSEISGIDKKILTEIEEGEDFDVRYFIKLCNIYRIKPHEIFKTS